MFTIWDTKDQNFVMATCGCCKEFFDEESKAEAYMHDNLIVGRLHKHRLEAWASRERANFASLEYQPPIWAKEPWYREAEEDIGAYAHIDPTDNTKILFTANAKDGERNRLTSTTPGRFLKKFFGHMTEDEVKHWAEKHKEYFDKSQDKLLHWASTPEEITAVYSMDASFGSCMQAYQKDKWDADVGHPVRAYGAGDLKVAYTTSNGRLIARAIVWPEKKLVGRVYGNGTLLRGLLKQYGLETDSNSNTYDTMVGARLLYLPLSSNSRWGVKPTFPNIVVPYIDGDSQGLELHEDGFLRICEPDREGTTTRHQYYGYSEGGVASSSAQCSCCRTWKDVDDNAGNVEDIENFGMTMDAFNKACVKCRAKVAFYCSLRYRWFSRKAFTAVPVAYHQSVDDDAYSSICLERNRDSVFKSDLSGKYFVNSLAMNLLGGKKICLNEMYTNSDEIFFIEDKNEYALYVDLVYFNNGNLNYIGSLRKARGDLAA